MSPPRARSPRQMLVTIMRLARTNMTVISAVTYLAGAVLGTTSAGLTFSTPAFLRGWAFVLVTQFMTHFLGEVFDEASDRLNRFNSGLTGGSRAADNGPSPVMLALVSGLVAAVGSFATLTTLVPPPARPVGLAMLLLAWAYSAPPPKLNHRALGELDGALITSALVPYFASAAQGAVSGAFPWWSNDLVFLVVPPFFVKISLFIMLNLADLRPDWAAGKITLPVLLGPDTAAKVHFACMALAYGSAVVLALVKAAAAPTLLAALRAASILLFILPSAPYGFSLSSALLSGVPYRLDPLLAPSLFHSTLLVWGVVLHTMLRSIPIDGLFTFQTGFAAVFMFVTINNVLKGKKKAAQKLAAKAAAKAAMRASSSGIPQTVTSSGGINNAGKATAQRVDNVNTVVGGGQDGAQATSEGAAPAATSAGCAIPRRDVTIVGGGVSGLVAAATLAKMGRSVIVLERRPTVSEAESGADLAMWPGALSILRELGVSDEFFEKHCFPLDKVYMCNMDFDRMVKSESKSASADSATILKTIDMAEVTRGTGERFVLVARQSLMDAIREIVPENLIIFGANVRNVEEDEENASVTVHFTLTPGCEVPEDFPKGKSSQSVSSRIVIGADGARSKLRAHVSPKLGGPEAIRFCGEVCYRGVLSFTPEHDGVPAEHETKMPEAERKKLISLFPDKPSDCVMRINYGAGLRSSFGYMSADGQVSYWWVKVKTDQVPKNRGKMAQCDWPEPLKTLHDLTPPSAFYMHQIEDSEPLPRWTTTRVALVGDAAHVVTPNMGQGACLATEDAFVLATQLAKNWEYPDGQLEAFYNYERIRQPCALGVLKEARKQLFLGQLSSKPAVFLRETLLKLIPVNILLKTLKKSNFPVGPYLEEYRQRSVVKQA